MILYDITMTIEEKMAVYKNRDEKKPRLVVTRDFTSGSVFETRLEMDLHTGTHVDMPLHIIPGGAPSEKWALAKMFTRCTVLDFSTGSIGAIGADQLEQKRKELEAAAPIFDPGRTVLLKTKNSLQAGFDFHFAYLERSGAAYLAGRGIGGVGIDALGIERDQPGHETHKLLLEAGIWILEGLHLGGVPEGEYILALLPLKIKGVEALPARAVLLAPGSMNLP